ncbi:hypothetical protein BZA05DRAFT_419316 [Tricharina praecox]|uniref:uncharacterized protein n=1 Tax=Tricharina praecox TaxID=43433 RepID=UPI00222105F5|nr:uncharacterized protein BZA05DRAFT_419316 [Tricharina praecox]KAI5850802.1 hypothetical protein BZA05DRAFT_419316 [Tricharina praecox]
MNNLNPYAISAGSPYAKENTAEDTEMQAEPQQSEQTPGFDRQGTSSDIIQPPPQAKISDKITSAEIQDALLRNDVNWRQQWEDVDLGLHSGSPIPGVPTNTPNAPSTWLTTSSPSTIAPSHATSSESTLFALPPPALSLWEPAAARHSNSYWNHVPHATRRGRRPADLLFSGYVPSQGSRWSWRRILGRSQSAEDLNGSARRTSERWWDRLFASAVCARFSVGIIFVLLMAAVVAWSVGSDAKKHMDYKMPM